MLGVSTDSMVFLDDGIEDISEILVGVPVTGVDSTMLVVELNSAGNSLGEGETGSCSDVLVELVPLLLGDMLCNQRVCGLDVGEVGDSPVGSLKKYLL